MRTSEMLYSIAKWLQSSDNEALLLAEQDETCMKIVAESCVLAAELLKTAADEIDLLEPQEASVLTPESIEETAQLATAFDASNDPQLKKIASVLDELLMTIAADPNEAAKKKVADSLRIEELRKKYHGVKKELDKFNKTDEVKKAIDKSDMLVPIVHNERPLSTRDCPLHFGQMLQRLGENIYRCPLDGQTIDWATGYTLENGDKVVGGDVALQTGSQVLEMTSIFDDRLGRLGYHQD